jgi:hypothetical protein
MHSASLDEKFVRKLYDNAVRLSNKYPDSFSLERLAPLLIGKTNGLSFRINTGTMGWVDLFSFYYEESEEYDDVVVSYPIYTFLDFFNRVQYIERLNVGEELVWIMSLAELLFWNNVYKPDDKRVVITRDPYDYLWLAEANLSRTHKAKLISCGVYDAKNGPLMSEIPDIYLEALTDGLKLEDAVYNLSQGSLPLRH